MEMSDFFCNGHHVLQRSDRFWAGLSTDLVIEQVPMKSVKTAGGLTHGRGMGESQRTQWLLTMPACAELNIAIQELTGVSNCTIDQHKEATYTRQSRDEKDTLAILAYLNASRLFFTIDLSLRNIASGVTADSSVDVDKAKDNQCWENRWLITRLKPVLNWANVCSPEHTSDTSTNYDSFLN